MSGRTLHKSPGDTDHGWAVYRVGDVTLDLGSRCLNGPRGTVQVGNRCPIGSSKVQVLRQHLRALALAERLMRQPGIYIPHSMLITALYPDPDAEPEFAQTRLRQEVRILRQMLLAVGSGRVTVVCAQDFGYAIEVRK